MKCSFCGKEVKEGASFCSFCGTLTSAPVAPAYNEITDDADKAPVKKKGRGKRVLATICIILSIVIVSGVVALGLVPLLNSGVMFPAMAVQALVNTDGRAFVCYGNGKRAQVGENVSRAYITSDREKVVVLTRDGELYFADSEGKNRVNIYSSDEKEEISLLGGGDSVVIYSVSEFDKRYNKIKMYYYTYSYESGTNVKLGSSDEIDSIAQSTSITLSSGIGSVAYAIDGSIYVLRGDVGKVESIGEYDKSEQVYIYDVSSDGKYVLWSKTSEKGMNVILSCDGKNDTIKSYDSLQGNYEFSLNCPLGQSDYAIVLSENCVYVMNGDKITEKEMPSNIASPYAVAANGLPISMCEEYDISDGFFLLTEGDEGYNVIFINRDIKSYEVAADVEDFYVSEGYFMYANEERTFVGEWDAKKYQLENVKSIYGVEGLSDVIFVGAMAYFTENDTLYRYDAKKNEKVKIADEVTRFAPTEDGKEVYYFTDVKADVVEYGTLKKASVNGDKTTVSNNVIINTLTSHLLGDVLSSGSVWFNTYSSSYDSGYKFNSVYYNGRKTNTVIKNISKSFLEGK